MEAVKRCFLQEKSGSCALCVVAGSSSAEDARAKQLEASSPVHLSLEQFQARDLSLYLSLAPRKGQGRFHGGIIALDAAGKSPEFHRGTLLSPDKPWVQLLYSSLFNHHHKILSQAREFLEISMRLAHLLDEPH